MTKLTEIPTHPTGGPPPYGPRSASPYGPPAIEDEPEESAQRKQTPVSIATSDHPLTATYTSSKTSSNITSPKNSSKTTRRGSLPAWTIDDITDQNRTAPRYSPVHTNSAAGRSTTQASNSASTVTTQQFDVMDPPPRPSSSLPLYQQDTANEPPAIRHSGRVTRRQRRRVRTLCIV